MIKKVESRASKINRMVFGGLFLVAGVLHFIIPGFYLSVMPDFLPAHEDLVNISGVVEASMGLVILLAPKYYRSLAAMVLFFLLLTFIVVHVDFLLRVECPPSGICWWSVFAWVRLVIIHPLLLFWAGTIAMKYFGPDREAPWRI